MRRFVALIVMIFAFASVAGTATAHAHRYVSTPIVVLNHVDAANRSIPVMVEVQRGQIDLGSGIVMPCGPHHAIPVSIATWQDRPGKVAPAARLDSKLADRPGTPLRRPPRRG